MPTQEKSLFFPVVPSDEYHPYFKRLMDGPVYHPARAMMDYIYQDFIDLDKNFLQQFQTKAFDARLFELYLFAYFSKSGFEIDHTQQRPDFIVTRDGVTVAVEATTAGPSDAAHAERNVLPSELGPEELEHYLHNDFQIKLGSALFSKLKEEYWKLDQCKGKPLVLAIEAFINEESLTLTDAYISEYLYGHRQSAEWTPEGVLEIHTENVDRHISGDKSIPSNFFAQEGAEYISAVMFTNSGTHAKFSRMGFQQGLGTDYFEIIRRGYSYTPDPDARDPSLFSYSLSHPPIVEWWGQGLSVFHNPNALFPLPRNFIAGALQSYIEDGLYKSDAPDWHPYSSISTLIPFHEKREMLLPLAPTILVTPISKSEFRDICPFTRLEEMGVITEDGWFVDESGGFFGAIFKDNVDGNWGWIILARDEYYVFRAIETSHSLPSRDFARRMLQFAIMELITKGQRIFPQ